MESDRGTQEVACPACFARHRIKSAMVGKQARCTCGKVFVISLESTVADLSIELAPASPVASKAPAQPIAEPYIAPPDEDPYAVAEQQATHAPPVRRAQSAAEAALARGYNPAHQRVETEDEHPPVKANIVLDLILPVILIPAGIALCFVQAMYFEKDGAPRPFAEIAPMTITGIIGSLVMMVGAVVAAGAGMGMGFHGSLWQTIMKTCAVALLPAAVGSIVSHRVGEINGDMLGVFTAVALYAALTKLILRQTWQDTGVIVFALWTMHAAVMWFNYKLQSAKSASPF